MKKLMMAAMAAVAAVAATADDYGFAYQATLKDDKGAVPETRNQTVEIRLWKTATGTGEGDLLWGRTYDIYTDENGLFNQEVSDSLGSIVPDWPSGKTVLSLGSVFCDNRAGCVYIGLKVKDSAGEIVPRQPLFAVPFGGRAAAANNLVGSSHRVGGTLDLAGKASLSSSGLNLAATSTSTVGVLVAECVNCSDGELTAKDISFSGVLKGSDNNEILAVPIEGIILWTQSTPPDGDAWEGGNRSAHWAICDGQNGTPDLRGRFIVGVGQVGGTTGTSYGYGQKGGAESVQLSKDEIPSHAHSYTFDQRYQRTGLSGSKYNYMFNESGSGERETDANKGDEAHENRPPYFALYYIMRIK